MKISTCTFGPMSTRTFIRISVLSTCTYYLRIFRAERFKGKLASAYSGMEKGHPWVTPVYEKR